MKQTGQSIKKFALIVAGGRGNRMKNELPKQFIEIAGLPILMHTINIFRKYDPGIAILLILPKQHFQTWKNLCLKFNYIIPHLLIQGGKERFNSVKNGLNKIDENGIVFIHDGVRPMVSIDTLQRCFQTALQKGNAIPAMPITESVRKLENGKNSAVNRSDYVLIQTPQTFNVKLIQSAYNQEYSPAFTDDASVLEANGEKINLVEGNRENIKITFPEDLKLGKTFFV